MNLSDDTASLLNHLSRNQLQLILENHGYGVYDEEPVEDLREAVRQDIESGEIDRSEIEMHLSQGSVAPSP